MEILKDRFKISYNENNKDVEFVEVDTKEIPSHCMNSVDCIIKIKDTVFFLELKNYSGETDIEKLQKLLIRYSKDINYTDDNRNNKSFVYDVAHKARDTFICEFSSKGHYENIIYIVVLSLPNEMDKRPQHLATIQKSLFKNLPVLQKYNKKYTNSFIRDVLVMNCNELNKNFKDLNFDIEVNEHTI